MASEYYEIGYKQKFPPVEGTFYDMIYAPNPKIAKQTMHKIYGKKEIRITSVTLAKDAQSAVKDTVRTGRI